MATAVRLRLGTRASALARWQAEWTASQLARWGAETELVLITTEGDTRSGPIGQAGGRGLFARNIQRALLGDRIDLAVHSLKDLPTEPIEGLRLAAVPERAGCSDVLVSNRANRLDALPEGARVGTGSLRRRAQLLHLRPDLDVQPIRGNVDTRLRKLDEGQYDAIVLAEAGLRRLGLERRITQVLPTTHILPAVGQGPLGLETRSGDERARQLVSRLDHTPTRQAVCAERAMLAALHGGCLAPVGAWGRISGGVLSLDGVVLSADGTCRIAASASGPPDEAPRIGETVAARLLEKGAAALIRAARQRG